MNPNAATFERRAVLSLASLYAFRMLGLFMVLPVLALYGTEYEGSTPLLLGLALGAYGFTQAILQIPFGMLSDRWGRKPVIALGLIIFAIGSAVAAYADTIYELILGRCLQGGGAIASAIMALVADLTSEEGRTKAMATIGASIGLSFSVALVLGPALVAIGGMSLIFSSTVLLALLGLVVLVKVIPTPSVSGVRHREAGAVPELLLQTLFNRELIRLNLGVFVLHAVLMAAFLVMPGILEQQLGIEGTNHWMVYLPLLVLAFATMIPFIIVAEKKRRIKPVFLGAIALLGLATLAMWHWHQGSLFLLMLFLYFVAFNLLEATLPSLMSKVAPAGGKGTASGVYATCQFLGAFLGGVGGGWLLQDYGVGGVFAGAVGLILCWLLFAFSMATPRFLTGVQIPLGGQDIEQVRGRLAALPGVEEVVLIAEEKTAYLKVDPNLFSREGVQDLELE
ncbi:MFS transporter [Pseudomaricurvus alkylphenolicus]|uniref:MFS transporter n=1 Tax=Pseudomaricurvus alkylphenolicus TaxID=1306991 RepID=UPI001F0E7EBE|nr:MFS transporter [Pseudomaricurvus alkylphenolicus]